MVSTPSVPIVTITPSDQVVVTEPSVLVTYVEVGGLLCVEAAATGTQVKVVMQAGLFEVLLPKASMTEVEPSCSQTLRVASPRIRVTVPAESIE